MNRFWPSNATWSRSSISSKVSASSWSSSRGPRSATRADRLCSEAARAAAVIRVHRAQRSPGDDPAEDRGEDDDHAERDQRVLKEMGEREVALVLRALKLEVRVAFREDALVGMGAQLLGAAPRQEAGRSLLALPLRLQPRHQDVADCHDDRPAHGEQAGVEQGQSGADGQPRAAAHIRYPLPITVSISGGSPSLRRSRVIVTETMLLNGSTSASHTCSSSSSALTTAPSAASSISRIPNSLRVRDSGREPRLARCRARSTVRSPRAQDRRRGRRPARERPHAGDELGEHERLAEVVVRAQLQAVDPVIDLRGGGEHEDPRAGAGERPAHLVTVHHRQVAVEHDHVIGRLRGGLQCRRAVVHGVDGHPRLTQPLSDPAGKRRMVLDHQHPHPPSMRRST